MKQIDDPVLRAQKCIEQKDYVRADQILTKILLKTPEHVDALLAMAKLASIYGRLNLEFKYLLKIYNNQNENLKIEETFTDFCRANNLKVFVFHTLRFFDSNNIASNLAHNPPAEVFKNISKNLNQSNLKQAVKLCWSALDEYPFSDNLYNALAVSLKKSGSLSKAILYYEVAILLNKNSAQFQSNLGNALREEKRFIEAEKALLKAYELDPKFPSITLNLGFLHFDQGKFDQSQLFLEKSIKDNPNRLDTLNTLGCIHLEAGRHNEALSYFNQVLKIEPNNFGALNNLGNLHKDGGDKVSAHSYYKKAISHPEADCSVHRNYSAVHKYTVGDQHLDLLLRLIDTKKKPADGAHLNFAVGKAYEDIKDYGKSFKHYAIGNKLRKEELGYSVCKDITTNNLIIERSLGLISAQHAGEFVPNRIFILGLPRSGTTLLESMLDSHSLVYGMGELSTFATILHRNGFFAEKMSQINLLDLGQKYLSETNSMGPNQECLIDKMPLNFRFCGLILEALPKSKIIHVVRDPTAVCWSNFRSYFNGRGNGFAYNLSDFCAFFESYIDMMQHWTKFYSDRILTVNYENLTLDPETKLREILNFLCLDWEKSVLNFHNNARAIKTASALQVRTEIYTGSSDRWKVYNKFLDPKCKKLINPFH